MARYARVPALIRRATADDADAIARVRIDTWRTTYRGHLPDALLDSLAYDQNSAQWGRVLAAAAPERIAYVAEDAGAVVAFVSAGPERTGDVEYRGEIYAIYVLDAHQRRGIGRALTRRAVGDLLAQGRRSLLIWVLRGNAKGRAFYEALGGRAVREREDEIEGVPVVEVGYGWEDAAPLAR